MAGTTGTTAPRVNLQLVESMSRLAKLLPFESPSVKDLQAALLKAADQYYQPQRLNDLTGMAENAESISAQLLNYVRQLADGGLQHISTPEELLDDFVGFLTTPVREAEREVNALEQRIHQGFSEHPAQKLTTRNFSHDLDAAMAVIEDYQRLSESLSRDLANMHRRIKVLDAIFADPDNLILGMRTRLHELSNVIAVQYGSTQGIIRYRDIETKRTMFFKGMLSSYDENLDPFLRIKTAYPQISLTVPRQRIKLPDPATIQSILHHLVQNAIKYGAERVAISVLNRRSDIITIAVLDDGPGIPKDIQDQLGKKIIGDSSGWYIMKNELVPSLGSEAEISFISPHRDGRGTLVKLTLALNGLPYGPRPGGGPSTDTEIPGNRGARDSAENMATVYDITSEFQSQASVPPQAPQVAGALSFTGTAAGVVLNFPLILKR